MPLNFDGGWGKGDVFNWYRRLTKPGAKSIHTIQIRKDVTGPVPHRFVLLHMRDGLVHRFDRRPDRSPGADTGLVRLLSNQVVNSHDTFMPDISPANLEHVSECEIELVLDSEVDFLVVVSACYAISVDDNTRGYSFLRYNCFFFSWTILMIVSRHYLPYEIPPVDFLMDRISSDGDKITSFVVDEGIQVTLDLIVVVSAIREREGASLREGMGTVERIIWALPVGFLKFVCRRLFPIRLRFGIRRQLTKILKEVMMKRVAIIHEETLRTRITHGILDEHLWIEDIEPTFKQALETEATRGLWEAVLEILSSAFGTIDPDKLAEDLTNPHLKFSLLGRNISQFRAVWHAALRGGLQAAKNASDGLDGLSHAEVFDKLCYAARDGALDAAKTVVNSTRDSINDRERDDMYESVWRIWNDCWDEVHKIASPWGVRVLNKSTELLVALAADAMIQEMRDSKTKTVQARMPNKGPKWPRVHRKRISHITNAELQQYMQNIMKKDTVGSDALEAIHASMGRIWKVYMHDQHAPNLFAYLVLWVALHCADKLKCESGLLTQAHTVVLVNVISGGLTPSFTTKEAGQMGAKMIASSLVSCVAAVHGIREAMALLKKTGADHASAKGMDPRKFFDVVAIGVEEVIEVDRRAGGTTLSSI
ncbi:hypothetical protein FRC10_002740 [Ceratobasidium sp. 414]|nr:hypothetical protein FRC10_002740 [Ceratobasidium sp. 414]